MLEVREMNDSDLREVRKQHPDLRSLPLKGQRIHDQSYVEMTSSLDGFVDKVGVFVRPENRSIGGLVVTSIPIPWECVDLHESRAAGRVDIIVNENAGHLVQNGVVEYFAKHNEGRVAPADFLRYAISHEYGHLFEIFRFNKKTRNGWESKYGGYSPLSVVGSKRDFLAVGEAFSHWLAESVTRLNGFYPEASYNHVNERLLLGYYLDLKDAEKQHGRNYVLNHAQELLQKSFDRVSKN